MYFEAFVIIARAIVLFPALLNAVAMIFAKQNKKMYIRNFSVWTTVFIASMGWLNATG